MLNELIAKIKQDKSALDQSNESEMVIEQFNRTLNYIKERSLNYDGVLV